MEKRIVKDFTQFVNENINIIETYETNEAMDSFISGDITSEKLEETLLTELESLLATNEGLKDIVKSGIKGIQNWFFKLLASTMKLVKVGGQKLLGAIKSIVNTIKKFENKYPTLFKALAIIVIVMIMITVSGTQALAGDGGDGMQQMMGEMVNIAAGLVSDLKDSGSLEGMDVDSIGQSLEAVKKQVLQTGDISGAVNSLEGIDASTKKVIKLVVQEAGNYVGEDNDTVNSLVQNGKRFLFDYADGNLSLSYKGN